MKPRLFLTIAFAIKGFTGGAGGGFGGGLPFIFQRKTFTGWKTSIDNTNTWQIEDGAFVPRGQTAHVFYVGETNAFKNFELKVHVMTEPNSNGGIYFHTAYQEKGFPRAGIECQVNVSHTDWIKTGSLYGLCNIGLTPCKDNQWWTQHMIVRGRKVTVKIDGKTILEYNEPPVSLEGRGKRLGQGTFAFQAHDPKSVICYKNIRVKRLD